MSKPHKVHGHGPRNRGFTLIELIFVVLVIAVFMGIATPRLAPMFIFADLETSSRGLAAFGARAMDHCILARDRFTVKVDLAEQEYWAMRWPKVTDEDEDGEDGLLGGTNIMEGAQSGALRDILSGEGGDLDDLSSEDLQGEAQALFAQMEWHQRTVLESRVRRVLESNVEQAESRLFDTRFSLERDENELEEVRQPLLNRTRLPEGIRIARVIVGEKSHTSGVVDIDITPVGLARPVTFEMRNDDGDVFTVKWMGNTRQGVIELGWTGPSDEDEEGT